MKKHVTITCQSSSCANDVYQLLTNPLSGEGVLKGTKVCVCEHETLPLTFEFELNDAEIYELQKKDEVISITQDDQTIKFNYTITEQKGIPRQASYTASFNGNSSLSCVPHSLFYGQNYKLFYTHSDPTSGSLMSLSSIDCSNVDILILDSGVDATHPDISANVVNFDWSLLKEGDPVNGTQIVGSVPSNYNEDTEGHGTACASLVAGVRCGFAKNAKIYSLRDTGLGKTNNGFSFNNCLKLALAFQKAKAQNLHNLNNSRPTVFTNSWGYSGPLISDDFNYNDPNTINLYTSIDGGKNSYWWNILPGINSVTDGYIRAYLNENMHVLGAAGNSNIYLTNSPALSFHTHLFTRNVQGSTYTFAILKTLENNSSYSLGNVYNNYYTYIGTSTKYMYSSPNIGLNFDKNSYPFILVGDISPLGTNDEDSEIYRSGGNSKAAYTVLSATNNTEPRILKNENVRYATDEGPFFIKTSYSNFGPDVDIYAPGNGCWAAMSNQMAATTNPTIVASVNGVQAVYRFFSGTSASCPIVAGILATYLAENPTATPSVAKQWLLDNAVQGNIMETEMNTLPISSYDGQTTFPLNVPFGCNFQTLSANSKYRITRITSQPSLYRQINIEDILFCCRFFNSNNKVAYAFPTRKAVVRVDEPSIVLNGVTLIKNALTDQAPTHNYS